MTTCWDEYLTVPDSPLRYGICRDSGEGEYAPLRETIGRVVGRILPKAVTCLGAGVLNDIPYDALVGRCRVVHLVDWLPGIIDSGIARAIVSRNAEGAFNCIYCSSGALDKAGYCTRYRHSADTGLKVCDRFVPVAGARTGCVSFERGIWPRVLTQDVTGGYATAFSRQACGCIAWC